MIKYLERVADRLAGSPAAASLEGHHTTLWEKASRSLYRYINSKLKNSPEICFLNYGYAPLSAEGTLELSPQDEVNRMYIQLYDRVVNGVDLEARDVLEISCGRGGGARYIKQYYRPSRMCGLDRSNLAVSFCKRQHSDVGLRFTCGDAQNLPFADGSFDAVVNVEASHDYPQFERFLSEVKRVLRDGGHFLYADFRKQQHCANWRSQIERSGMQIVSDEDITANVVKGLELNTDHHKALVRKLAPAPLRPLFRQFAGTTGSYVYRTFEHGKQKYRRYRMLRV
jgi:ubiquinone/menaquinone biosynthesis C-methylase UbiE